jgi:hypothetical protein
MRLVRLLVAMVLTLMMVAPAVMMIVVTTISVLSDNTGFTSG